MLLLAVREDENDELMLELPLCEMERVKLKLKEEDEVPLRVAEAL